MMKRSESVIVCLAFLTFFGMVDCIWADTFTVTNLNDSGEGSLRWAIGQANANSGSDTIGFGVSGTISPTSALPSIADDGTVINASSQWIGAWPSGQPGITLDGSGAGDVNGLVINGANNCHIRGLFITNFGKSGIHIHSGAQSNTIGGTTPGERNVISGNNEDGVRIGDSGTGNNVVSGNYIGADVTGTVDLGNAWCGVRIHNGAQSDTIGGTTPGERNIISGNDATGVGIYDPGSDSNVVSGNFIGTDVTGTAALGNAGPGVSIASGPRSNIIGGITIGERNVISGNNSDGVAIGDSGTGNNIVSGNYIGTDVTGAAALGNSGHGVGIWSGAQSNTIGGATDGEKNIISGNDGIGVVIYGTGANNNIVSGNCVGTDVSGTVDLGNTDHGILISNGAQSNTIGGITIGERNIISGNNSHGVFIESSGTDNNVISGNYIGTDTTGAAALGNSGSGVTIVEGAQSNTIGGTTEDERNIISGNSCDGVHIAGTGNNVVSGNYIGTDVTGTAALGNTEQGVRLDSCQFNIIGGATPGERNIISGNHQNGVVICDPGVGNNKVSGNYIGTDFTGTVDLGNTHSGVALWGEAKSNVIGGTTAGERNIISGNHQNGVAIWNSGTGNNVVSGNFIGTDVTGTAGLGNSGVGVNIAGGAQFNTIGGTTEGERNIISGNNIHGVSIESSGTDNNVISGNYIGTDATGTAALGNAYGIVVGDGAQSNTIGGTTAGERNIISGNDEHGVVIGGSGTDNNVISGNYIGTDVSGAADLGNATFGITINTGAQSNIIGGTTDGQRNIISGNGYGVTIESSDSNVVSGNYIGTDVTGIADLGNSEIGVIIYGGAQSNIIGGTTAGERNIISGNDGWNGVEIRDSGTGNNAVSGNYIGTDITGIVALGNAGNGVWIGNGTQSNTIGGTTAGERNTISGNDGNGVSIVEPGTSNNVVSGNYIGTDITGTADLGNSGRGVTISGGAQSNTIGGTTEGERNIIFGNDADGVSIAHSGTNSNVVSGNYIGTDANGTGDLGNAWSGVSIYGGAQSSTVSGNVIAFNSTNGVRVHGADTDYNRISQNSMHDNAGLGIRLLDGGNDEISAPVVTSVALVGDTLIVSGYGAGGDATVEVFAADSAESGEGKVYLGDLIADGSGDFSGQIDVTGKGLSPGDPIVATTTHTDNNTSEFSVPITVILPEDVLSIPLYQGFNLFSIPFNLPNTALSVVLADIFYSIDSVFAFRGGLWYGAAPDHQAGTWDDQIGTIDGGETFVIYMVSDDTLSVAGTPLLQTAVVLNQGFNLAPYNYYGSPKTVEEAFAGIRDYVDTIFVYDAVNHLWLGCTPNPAGGWDTQFDTLSPGVGIVIYCLSDGVVWDVGQ